MSFTISMAGNIIRSQRLSRWFRFVAGGGLNAAATYLVYIAALQLIPYQWAYLLAYVSGVLFAYWYNAKFVFRVGFSWKGVMAYPLVYVAQYALSAIVLGSLVEFLGISEYLAPIVVVVALTPITYVLNKLFLTRGKGDDVDL